LNLFISIELYNSIYSFFTINKLDYNTENELYENYLAYHNKYDNYHYRFDKNLLIDHIIYMTNIFEINNNFITHKRKDYDINEYCLYQVINQRNITY